MKALNLYGINDLRYEDVPMPARKKGEVTLKIKASGICGSDILRVYDKGAYHYPTIIGHEFSGQIIDADKKELIGRKAAVFPLKPCFKCEACKEFEYAQCHDYDYYGSRCDGGMAEYICVNEFNLVFMPDNLSYEEGALVEPCSVALHAISQTKIKKGETVAVFGAGPIGCMLAMWAKALSAGHIILVDIDQSKVDFAKSLGFDAVNPVNINIEDYIKADVCIEGAGVPITLEQAIKCAKNFGRVICMGNPAKDMNIPLKTYSLILRKQLHLIGTWNSSYSEKQNDWAKSLQAMSDGSINALPLVSHRFKLSDNMKAFDLMKNGKEYYNKVMFINE